MPIFRNLFLNGKFERLRLEPAEVYIPFTDEERNSIFERFRLHHYVYSFYSLSDFSAIFLSATTRNQKISED